MNRSHARILLPLGLLLSAACGSGYHGGVASAPSPGGLGMRAAAESTRSSAGPTNIASDAPAREQSEALVLEAFITARVDDVQTTADAIGKRVRDVGGRVIRETGNGASKGWRSYMRVRVPPREVDALLAWLGEGGTIEQKRIQVEDVSKQLFDQELAEKNLRATLARLQALLEREDLNVEAVLKIEAEMTRVRGEIEALQGNQRFLKDRVAFATIDFTLRRKDGVDHAPTTKFFVGTRASNMTLGASADNPRNRQGLGLTLQIPIPDEVALRVNLETNVYEAAAGGKRPFFVSMGFSTYSDHLGGGTRTFLNPYLGVRAGFGRLDAAAAALSIEGGLELFKHKYGTLDLNVRGSAIFEDNGDEATATRGAVVTSAGISVPF